MHNNSSERIDNLMKRLAINIVADRAPEAEEALPDPLGDLLRHIAEMKRHDEARAADATRNRETSAAVTDLLKNMTKK